MKMKIRLPLKCAYVQKKERGAVIPMVAIMMVVVVALAALAIDLSHLMVVKNEL